MTVTIHRDFGQRSDDWYAARRGMVTASTIGQLVTVGAPAPVVNDRTSPKLVPLSFAATAQ